MVKVEINSRATPENPENSRLYVAALPLSEGEALACLREAIARRMEVGEFLTGLIRDGLQKAEEDNGTLKETAYRSAVHEELTRHVETVNEIYKDAEGIPCPGNTPYPTPAIENAMHEEIYKHMVIMDDIDYWIDEGITRRARKQLGID